QVVRRLANAAAVEELSVAQLVALPSLADGESAQQGKQCRQKGRVLAHDPSSPEVCSVFERGRTGRARSSPVGGSSRYEDTSAVQRRCAFNTNSMKSRAAPFPPARRLT